MSKLSTTEPAGAASPLAVLKAILANPTDLAHVKQYRRCRARQYMEDTFGTVRSFLDSGSYRIKSNPDGSTVDV